MDTPETSTNVESPVEKPSPLHEHKMRIERRLSRTLAVSNLTVEQERDLLFSAHLLKLGISLGSLAAIDYFGKEFVRASDSILNKAEDLPKE